MGIIYIATCKINNKSYVGKTINSLERRKSKHRFNATNSKKSSFYNAIRKYGFENFNWRIIGFIEKELLNDAEKACIEFYRSNEKKYGYNLTIGGDGQDPKIAKETGKKNKGRKLTEEHKKKISEWSSNRRHSMETKEKMSQKHKGKSYSKETLDKMAAAQKQRLSNKQNHPMYMKKHSEETKNKISLIHKGKIPWNKGLKMISVLRAEGIQYI